MTKDFIEETMKNKDRLIVAIREALEDVSKVTKKKQFEEFILVVDEKVTALLQSQRTEMLAEVEGVIEPLCTHFPVRESDEFDDGRESMKREVKEALSTLK